VTRPRQNGYVASPCHTVLENDVVECDVAAVVENAAAQSIGGSRMYKVVRGRLFPGPTDFVNRERCQVMENLPNSK
jgi:hypothetical protein